MKLVFLSSGGGGTAKAIHSLISNRITTILPTTSMIYIIADRSCGATNWAIDNNIPTKVTDLTTDESWRKLADNDWMENSDLIITTIHKIIPDLILKKYAHKMINIHFSILPAFDGKIGKKTVLSSIEYGSKLFGASCHCVTKEVDRGKPICQIAYASDSEDINDLTHYCFLGGCLTLFNGIANCGHSKQCPSPSNVLRGKNIDFIINPCHRDTQKVLDFLCNYTYS